MAELTAADFGGTSAPAFSNATPVVTPLPPGAPIYLFDPHVGRD